MEDKDEIHIDKRSRSKKVDANEKNIYLIVNGEEKNFSYTEEEFVFVNIFSYIDFDLSKPKGKLVLKVNNREAQYMEALESNDKVEVYWER